MLGYRIVAVGSNRLLADELVEAVKLILGEEINVEPFLSDAVNQFTPGELFVCNPTPLNQLMKVISSAKILVLNFTPTSQFFVQVARIPQGEKVYIFNNKLEYTHRLAKCCTELGIHEIEFIPIAYEEMPENEVTAKISQAKYIIGVDKLVGPHVLFSAKYKPFINPGTTVIGAKRVASLQSACALVQWVAARMHEDISGHLKEITHNLNEENTGAGVDGHQHDVATISEEIRRLVEQSTKSAETIRKAILHSVTNQIIPNMFYSHEDVAGEGNELTNHHPLVADLYKTLDTFSALSDELISINSKLPLTK